MLLSVALGIGAIQYVLDITVLAPLRASLGLAPWTGWAWGAALLSHSIRLIWPAAVVGTALALFTHRRPWVAMIAWAAGVVVYTMIHPLSPTGGQARFHVIAEAIGAISAAAIAATWYRSKPTERATSAQLTFTAIVIAELAATPGALHMAPFESWATPQMIYLMTFGLIAVMHGYAIWVRVMKCERRQDSTAKAVLRSNLVADTARETAGRAESLAIEARDLADVPSVGVRDGSCPGRR
jgi:hypothetical protein